MKIAVSGSHNTGKTTLVEALADLPPTFAVFEEPYYQLVEEGHVFAEMPSLEDFELQLERSIETLGTQKRDCIFDRCPYDILAYLLTHDESAAFEIEGWLPLVEDAVRMLDVIVFVPIEDPDRMEDPESDHADLRRRVDGELAQMILEDRWNFGVLVVEVTGSAEERLQRIQEAVNLG
jgi:hypothetical protein